MSTPTYIRAFVEAVYPDAPDLALESFNEEKCIRDATALIAELQAAFLDARRLREALQDLEPPLMVLANADNRHMGRLPTYMKIAVRAAIASFESGVARAALQKESVETPVKHGEAHDK